MKDNRITIRFSEEELRGLKNEAANSGLPLSTYIKRMLMSAFDRDRLAQALENDAEQKLAEREVWKRETANLVLIKAILLKLATKEGMDVSRLENGAQAAAEDFFADIFGEMEP